MMNVPVSDVREARTQSDSHILQVSIAYSKAWDEFNTRVTARHSIINLYINTSAALLGLLVLSDVKIVSLQRAAFYAMPALALGASALLFVHDLSMNNLIKYMVYIETRDPDFPSYHVRDSDDRGPVGYGHQKFRYRVWQSLCLALIFLAFCATAFVIGTEKPPAGSAPSVLSEPEFIGIYWVMAAVAVILKGLSIRSRYRATARPVSAPRRTNDEERGESSGATSTAVRGPDAPSSD